MLTQFSGEIFEGYQSWRVKPFDDGTCELCYNVQLLPLTYKVKLAARVSTTEYLASYFEPLVVSLVAELDRQHAINVNEAAVHAAHVRHQADMELSRQVAQQDSLQQQHQLDHLQQHHDYEHSAHNVNSGQGNESAHQSDDSGVAQSNAHDTNDTSSHNTNTSAKDADVERALDAVHLQYVHEAAQRRAEHEHAQNSDTDVCIAPQHSATAADVDPTHSNDAHAAVSSTHTTHAQTPVAREQANTSTIIPTQRSRSRLVNLVIGLRHRDNNKQ